jgi:hypothetical protein
MTNYEKIKNFTLDEMADFINDCTGCSCCSRRDYEECMDVDNCATHIKEYLESEAE